MLAVGQLGSLRPGGLDEAVEHVAQGGRSSGISAPTGWASRSTAARPLAVRRRAASSQPDPDALGGGDLAELVVHRGHQLLGVAPTLRIASPSSPRTCCSNCCFSRSVSSPDRARPPRHPLRQDDDRGLARVVAPVTAVGRRTATVGWWSAAGPLVASLWARHTRGRRARVLLAQPGQPVGDLDAGRGTARRRGASRARLPRRGVGGHPGSVQHARDGDDGASARGRSRAGPGARSAAAGVACIGLGLA